MAFLVVWMLGDVTNLFGMPQHLYSPRSLQLTSVPQAPSSPTSPRPPSHSRATFASPTASSSPSASTTTASTVARTPAPRPAPRRRRRTRSRRCSVAAASRPAGVAPATRRRPRRPSATTSSTRRPGRRTCSAWSSSTLLASWAGTPPTRPARGSRIRRRLRTPTRRGQRWRLSAWLWATLVPFSILRAYRISME